MEKKSIEAIRDDFIRGAYQVDRPRYFRYEYDAVIDPNQSAEWNANKVKELNDENKKALREYREKCDLLYKQMKQDVIESICETYEFTNTQAQLIYDFCHDEWSGNMADMFYFVEEISLLIKQFNGVTK